MNIFLQVEAFALMTIIQSVRKPLLSEKLKTEQAVYQKM